MSVDLVVLYRSDAAKAESKLVSDEYTRLVQTLKNGGLQVTGKKGDKQGRLLVFVHCPEQKLSELAHTDASRAFVHGLTSSHQAINDGIALSPAERNRLVSLYVCSSKNDGGLGITPSAREWTRVESVMSLHDQQWNDKWIKKWSTSLDVEGSLDQLRAQFGESLAMYFAFLSFYLRSLIVPAALGVFAFLFLGAFSSLYSVALLVWSLVFVEWWNIKERKLSVRWGVRGASNVELVRAEYSPEGDVWWKRELKVIASLPVIAIYATLLISLMTAIFIFEAFITQLYTGPGHQHIGLAPTVLFVVLVPRLLAFYHNHAVKLTEWENHPRQSSYDRSLTLKTFALGAIVAFGGLALSAFVYIPFGGQIMHTVQSYLSANSTADDLKASGLFKADQSGMQGEALIQSMKGMRLRNQVFAFTVTNQVINFVLEVIVPWVTESVERVKSKGKLGGKKKRVEWEDEASASRMSKEDRELLDAARTEAALPDYQLFGDYNEMIMQFGYVAIWSTCWPLAPLMALINNWIELRSDAFKIAKLGRRPLASRTDSIGAWISALSFITWLGALINAALVYLFHPVSGTFASTAHAHHHLTESFTSPNASVAAAFPSAASEPSIMSRGAKLASALHGQGTSIMLTAVVIALLASHGYLVLRAAVRHTLERALWRGSEEERIVQERELEVREARVRAASLERADLTARDGANGVSGGSTVSGLVASEGFWVDEGAQEIANAAKTE